MFMVSSNPLSLAPPSGDSRKGSSAEPATWADTARWFCLRAAGRREHLTALALTQRTEIETFVPRIRVRRERRAGGVGTITEALFPGYLFARFRHPEQTRHVVSTNGVLGLVAFGGPPPSIAEDAIAHLRLHAEPQAPALVAAPIFEEGDWVRVAAGCFRGTEGRVRPSVSGQDRVRLLLSLLGHEVEISVPADHLIARASQSVATSAALRTAIRPGSTAAA
jgi:transcriptional antiterminator RfaH